MRRFIPSLLVIGAFAALSWAYFQSRQEMIANAMQQARDTLPLAAETAANSISNFLTKRFEILQQAAADDQIIELIQNFRYRGCSQ